MGGHQSARMKKDEWLTPQWILHDLGPFDLDPCAPINRPWPMAANHYTIEDNGLMQDWDGRVWCNPPYGTQAGVWLSRCACHKNATALIFARTETKMFHKYVWNAAYGCLFLRGRLHFHSSNGERAKANAGAPSVLVAYDEYNFNRLVRSSIKGRIINLTNGV